MSVDQVRDMCREVGELHKSGRIREAAGLAEAAQARCEATLGRTHYAWPLTLVGVATCCLSLGERQRARTLVDDAVTAARALQADDFEHARAALTHAAELYAELGEHKAALRLWQDLIQWTGEELGQDHPRYFAERERLSASLGEAQTPSKART